ncbi:MAG: hypothetical protein FD123_405 [Bacteroidetes bacterium]|nr:MAG: hypothetical protein FD123_405 [Bacteroidota bacterium]
MTVSEQKRFYEALGAHIKTARVTAGLKQETLAKLLKLSRASIVNIEKGRQHTPTHTLWDMAKVLKIDVAKLLPGFTTSEVANSEIQKRIVKESNIGKRSKEQLIDFIEHVHTQISVRHE